jgi:hypothetical protein
MERTAGFAHDDAAQTKLDKLDALLARSFTRRQDAALLAEMLSLPNDGRYPTLELAPQQRRPIHPTLGLRQQPRQLRNFPLEQRGSE